MLTWLTILRSVLSAALSSFKFPGNSITLLRTYEEVNLGEDAVYEEVGDHVNPPGNRPGEPNQQTRKARKCHAHYRGSRAPLHPQGSLENDQGDTLPGQPGSLYIFIGWELTRKNYHFLVRLQSDFLVRLIGACFKTLPAKPNGWVSRFTSS